MFIVSYYKPPNMGTKNQVLKSGHFITRCELNNAWRNKKPLNESR